MRKQPTYKERDTIIDINNLQEDINEAIKLAKARFAKVYNDAGQGAVKKHFPNPNAANFAFSSDLPYAAAIAHQKACSDAEFLAITAYITATNFKLQAMLDEFIAMKREEFCSYHPLPAGWILQINTANLNHTSCATEYHIIDAKAENISITLYHKVKAPLGSAQCFTVRGKNINDLDEMFERLVFNSKFWKGSSSGTKAMSKIYDSAIRWSNHAGM